MSGALPSAGAADRHGAARRAVEALRSGVPSRAAVAALGAAQTDIEDRFATLLDQVRSGKLAVPRPGGLIVGGGFGAGKSHLLEHLPHLALQSDFVVSRVVISKETPLHDPVKVFRAAAESASRRRRTFSGLKRPLATTGSETKRMSVSSSPRSP